MLNGKRKRRGFSIADILQNDDDHEDHDDADEDENGDANAAGNSPSVSDGGYGLCPSDLGNQQSTYPMADGDQGRSSAALSDALSSSSSSSSSKQATDHRADDGRKKNRKSRTIFTDKQLQALEEHFERQKYLSVQDRLDVAKKLKLSDVQIKTWWQNRRTKWKRQSAVGYELLNETANRLAVQQLLQSQGNYWASYLNALGRPLTSDQLTTKTPFFDNRQSVVPPPPSTFRYFPATDENHYPSVLVPTPKTILTVDSSSSSTSSSSISSGIGNIGVGGQILL